VNIRCPRDHWFNAPIEALTWEKDRIGISRTARFVRDKNR
jgi:hypothetical protein